MQSTTSTFMKNRIPVPFHAFIESLSHCEQSPSKPDSCFRVDGLIAWAREDHMKQKQKLSMTRFLSESMLTYRLESEMLGTAEASCILNVKEISDHQIKLAEKIAIGRALQFLGYGPFDSDFPLKEELSWRNDPTEESPLSNEERVESLVESKKIENRIVSMEPQVDEKSTYFHYEILAIEESKFLHLQIPYYLLTLKEVHTSNTFSATAADEWFEFLQQKNVDKGHVFPMLFDQRKDKWIVSYIEERVNSFAEITN